MLAECFCDRHFRSTYIPLAATLGGCVVSPARASVPPMAQRRPLENLPGLPTRRTNGAEHVGKDPDLRARLHWNFVQFIKRLTARRPLLIVFETRSGAIPRRWSCFTFWPVRSLRRPCS